MTSKSTLERTVLGDSPTPQRWNSDLLGEATGWSACLNSIVGSLDAQWPSALVCLRRYLDITHQLLDAGCSRKGFDF